MPSTLGERKPVPLDAHGRSRLPRLLTIVTVAALVGLLPACGGGKKEGGGQQVQSTANPQKGQKPGGKLTALAASDVDSIDPGQAYFFFTYQITYATQRPLYSTRPEDPNKLEPDLAASPAEVSKDGRAVTVKIKEGIRFSPPVDREVTSEDVKYAIERGFTASVPNGYASIYFGDLEGAPEEPGDHQEIDGIETPDERTIRFKLAAPTGAVLAQALALPLSAPVPEEYAEKYDREEPSTYGMHQVFTGPYAIEADDSGELTGYEPGKVIRLERNPSWDRKTDFRPAYLDEIEIQEGNENTTAAGKRILAGKGLVNANDFAPPAPVLKQAVQQQKDQVVLTPASAYRWMSLNTKVEPFDDINVRRAVIAGVDRERLRLARGGELTGDVPTHFLPPEIPGFVEAGGTKGPGLDFLAKPKGDPKLSADYFKQAGFESGRYEGKKILVVGDDAEPGKAAAQVALEELRKLGFETTFKPVKHELQPKFCGTPKEKVAVCANGSWGKDFNDPQTLLDPVFNGENILPTNGTNFAELDEPEINKAMKEAAEIVDPKERARAWGRIDKLVTEQAPGVPYLWDKQGNVRSSDVQGVVNQFTAGWDLSFTSLK
jgi:peptide/nickel transport system substrate-binding protein